MQYLCLKLVTTLLQNKSLNHYAIPPQTHPNGKEFVENQSLVDHFHQTCVRSGFLVGIAH
jgi:hypothetical protein